MASPRSINALSTYFVVYVTSSLFAGVDKGVATKLIGIITGLVVVIRIAEIFIDPLLGNIIDNTTTKWGRFRPWQFLAGAISSVLIVLVYTGLFGLVNVNTTLFIVLVRHHLHRCSTCSTPCATSPIGA